MSTLPKKITDKFMDELLQIDDITEAQVKALRELMENGTKLKAADVELVFTAQEEAAL